MGEKEKVEEKNNVWKKKKIKINKLFLNISSNSFYLFSSII